ncbi:hypothetical protein M9458_054816 [Cirrhinus mrigala]|uniref:Gypsy retrotransposon integrase-like protein 1 n=1 Tax=Cirrhinus mrigala TaxID=683832 RepID=A0ABD0MI69_CIRMR
MLEQRSLSLEDHTRLFVGIGNLTHYRDYCLYTFYKTSLNDECRARFSGDGLGKISPPTLSGCWCSAILSDSGHHRRHQPHPRPRAQPNITRFAEHEHEPKPTADKEPVSSATNGPSPCRATELRIGARAHHVRTGSPMAMPATFAGEAVECSGFLLQVNLFIKMQRQLFTSDDAKVIFLISLLTGKALLWAKAIWNADNPIIHSYKQFTNHFTEVFSTTTGELATSDQLFRLQQGTSSVNHYTLHFRTLAAASGRNEKALLGAYRQGLSPDLRAAMALYDDSIGALEAFLQRTTKVAQNLAACQPPITAPQPASVAACHPENHWGVGKYDTLHPSSPCKLVCFIEDIKFLVLEDSTASIILGRPWLQQHHPELSWDPCDVLHWSDYCNQHCLIKVPRPSADPLILSSTRIESPDQASVPEVPAEYMAFQDVFSKQAATQLPPHRPWDCAIDLLPGAQLPKGRVYPLSIPERQAMEEYISEALAQGYIQPSTSPAASSFFFVGKKDGGLRPCIDYRQLNSQVIQQPYPLPLVPAALEELRGAQVFTKLDLRSAYNLVRIRAGDEWKTAFVTPTGHYEYRVMPYGLSISPSVFQTFMNEVFREFLHRFVIVYIDILIYSRNMAEHRHYVQQVLHKLREHRLYLKLEKCEFHRPSVHFLGYISAEGVQMDQGKISVIQEWPQPLTVKELQRFLGFANFYRRFIKDYSTITAPLNSLLRGKPKTISWNPSAHEAFLHLKKIFSTAPLLHHPDPELPFTVEVDASTTGAGAVLSQAVEQPVEPEPIVPSNLIISPIVWELDEDIHSATLQEAAPPECPEGKIFVPLALRQNLLDTAHRSPGSGHPGSQRTLSLLQSRYWWPSMRRDTIRYVQSCSVCAMSTSPRQLPTGKLVPLPIPQRPWSHIGVDFVTDLPAAEGNTCILLMVDRFSKMCKFFPLKGLPTAMETAETLFQHLFRHFGLPEEIVSDRGPQFISHVWKAFFKLLGVTVNLSSGYHPQTNGQTERKIQELGHYLRLSTRDLRLHQPCRKLSPRYIGPFKILRRINDVTFQLQLPPRYRIHPTFHISLLKPCYPSATEQPGAEVEPPPPEILEPPSIYTVHEILGSRRRGGQLEYLVDWEGYGPEERSWVSRDDILDPTLLSDFHRDHSDQPAPRGRGRTRRCVRASGAAPGGGGSVRHSPLPPSSDTHPVAPPTCSLSPEF